MRPSVLIVDDDPKLVELLRLYLERDGYRVRTAGTGREALDSLADGQPDLLVLDLMLPEVSGLDVCRAVRERSDLPIIMLTAKTMEADRIAGLNCGADDYVTKPFSPGELLARIRAVLRRAGNDDGPPLLTFGDLEIDFLRHEVRMNGTTAGLTATEFRLLGVMAREPGRVFTRRHLIHAVMGYDFDGFERTIDAHVKNIRRKFGRRRTGQSPVKTVHGVGYSFDPERRERAV